MSVVRWVVDHAHGLAVGALTWGAIVVVTGGNTVIAAAYILAVGIVIVTCAMVAERERDAKPTPLGRIREEALASAERLEQIAERMRSSGDDTWDPRKREMRG